MSKAADQSLTFYPAYCFSASPTFNAWVKLTAAGIHALNARRGFEGQGIYFYQNHPVQWVQVTGLVVDFEPNDLYWLFHVDDGSGALVEVVLPRKIVATTPFAKPGEIITFTPQLKKIGVSVLGNEIDVGRVEIGEMVKVKGGIREFRSVKQIALERLFYVTDTASEVQAWEASITQYQNILSNPWHLSIGQERALKRKAQGKVEKDGKKRTTQQQSKHSVTSKPNEVRSRTKEASRNQPRRQVDL